jgi:N-acetylmuramoyl-L-alanine amidase
MVAEPVPQANGGAAPPDGILSRVIRRLSALLAMLLVALPLAAQEEEDQAPEVPRVQVSTTGTLLWNGAGTEMPLLRTAAGPLVGLPQIVRRLGGELQAVEGAPEAFVLDLEGSRAVLGAGSEALTIGEDIVPLSQAPVLSTVGPLVPIDLLQRVYGDTTGYQFDWQDADSTLAVSQGTRRQVALAINVVQVEGLTTLVLRFDQAPRYQIKEEPGLVRVELTGDVLHLTQSPRLPNDSLAQRVRVSPDRVVIQLASGVRADHYLLSDPFRLVFDLYRGAPPTGAQTPEIIPPRKQPGIHTIVLDPGHGGDETGATGPGGTEEKTVTLALAQQLQQSLQARLPVKVDLTRTGDEAVPLDDRSAFANADKADLFISIHLNSTRGKTAHGAETYFLSLTASDEAAAAAAAAENASQPENGDPLYDLQLMLWDLAQSRHLAESQRLAKLIQAELNDSLDLRDRGVKQAPFRVLKGAAMPAVLVELGFINNPDDERRLNDPDYRQKLVNALVRAVQRFSAEAFRSTTRSGASSPDDEADP